MSAAASSARRRRLAGYRLRRRINQINQAMANGRIPALLVVIVTGLLLAAFLLTNDYRVETVRVEGVTYGDAREVVGASDMLDRSSFHVNLEQAAERIAELPYVSKVTVELTFPGQAVIEVEERRPEIVVEQGDQLSMVSADGTLIASGEVEGLPVLQVEIAGSPDDDALPAELVAAVRDVAAVYGPRAELLWNRDIGLAMERQDDRLIIFGEPREMAAKLAVLDAIGEQIDDDWTQLDLRVPTRPAYR